MRILNLAFGYYPQNVIAEKPNHDVIYACVNLDKQSFASGKVIKLPNGKFDIVNFLKQLPNGWYPDLISISSSLLVAQDPPIPLGINKLDCPTVMKLSDSHHGFRPIQNILEYSLKVGCQYHWTIYDRHHLHFYKEAGLSNVFWMPGAININLSYKIQPSLHKEYDVIFCGKSDDYHFYRKHLLEYLSSNSIKVARDRFTDIQMVYDAYSKSKIVFNCSLNGDLNLRVFETLMSGGFLLTDKLSCNSGLTKLFNVGKHFDCYESEQELIEKVQMYLKNPEKALEIAIEGQDYFLKNYHPQFLKDTFYNYLVKGEPLPCIFSGINEQNMFLIARQKNDIVCLKERLYIYEFLQSIQQFNLKTEVLCFLPKTQSLINDIQDLERLKLTVVSSTDELEIYKEKNFSIIILEQDSLYLLKSNYLKYQLPDNFQSCNLLIITGSFSFLNKILLKSNLSKKGFVLLNSQDFKTNSCLVFLNTSKLINTNLNMPINNNKKISIFGYFLIRIKKYLRGLSLRESMQ